MTTYRLVVLGQSGMYTYGDPAVSSELARLAVGSLLRTTNQSGNRPQLLGIVQRDGGDIRYDVLIEAEEWPGQWTVGVPGTPKYSPGVPRDVGNLDTAVRLDPKDPVAKLALADAIAESA